MLVVDRPRSDVKPSLLHFTFWIYRNKSTNRTGHKTIIVVVKTFRSVVMQNILIPIHHQIFWLPWIFYWIVILLLSQNGDVWGGWIAQHIQRVCEWTTEQGGNGKWWTNVNLCVFVIPRMSLCSVGPTGSRRSPAPAPPWWWWTSRMTSSPAASPSSTAPPARTGRMWVD